MRKNKKTVSLLPVDLQCTLAAPPTLEFLAAHDERLAVSVLDEDLVRVRVYPQGQARLDRTWLVLGKNGLMPFEGRAREDISQFQQPPFKIQQTAEKITCSTRTLQVEIALSNFALRWLTNEGTLLAADAVGNAYPYAGDGEQVNHHLFCQPGERYYGFGEVSGKLNKAKRHILFKDHDALGYNARNGSPLYKHIPFYITYQPASGIAFGLFYDNLATTTFDLGAQSASIRSYSAEAGDIDYYFIYGPTIPEVVEKFTKLTGRALLTPRWSLGYMGSTMSYTDAPDAQVQLAKFAQKCSQHKIPCTLFHLSSGYSQGEDGKRYVFQWNRKRVPDPQAMVDDFHANGIRLAANIKPALLTTHPRFEGAKALGAFIREPDGVDPQLFPFWGGTAAALDFSNPVTINWWMKQVKEQLLDYGIDSTWNDNNEFEVQERNARCAGFGRPFPIKYARPLQTLLMMRASYEAQLETSPNERPFLISRSGAPSMQRYVQTWSGDNFTSRQTLKYNIPMGLGLGLSGVANTGHDVGGFAGPLPSPELFVRWVQNGIFHPRFTIHSWKAFGAANEPWMYPGVLPIIRETIAFRYRLIPYLYNLLVESAETGHPIVRPLVYEFPNDPHCTDESFDFMLGPSLFVASVLTPFTRQRRVYLPAGQDWFGFYTQRRLAGGKTHMVAAPLEHIPLFVPENTMLPRGEVVHPLFHAKDDVRQILLFPSSAEGNTSLVLSEDDGHSLGYQKGELTRLHIDLHSSTQNLELNVTIDPYGYALPYSELEFILPAGEKRPLVISGKSRQWTDAESRLHLAWQLPEFRG